MISRRLFLSSSIAALLAGCTVTRGAFTAPNPQSAYSSRKIIAATNRVDLTSTARSDRLNFYDLDIAVPRQRTIGTVPVEGPDAFALIRQRPISTRANLAQSLGEPGRDPLVVWVHGFNNSSAEAVYRQAQMATDTGMNGPQISFLWPSAARARAYLFDRDSALQARSSLQDLFLQLGEIWPGPITVISHSLGCLLVMEALVRLHLQNRAPRLNGLMLLQPDIAPDVFAAQVSDISPLPHNAVLVTARDDPALFLSARLAESNSRVGSSNTPEIYEAMGFSVIDLTDITDAGDPHLVALTSPTVLGALRQITTN